MALRRSLRRKFFMGYASALLFITAILGWAFVSLYSVRKATSGIISENYLSIEAAYKMIDLIDRQDNALLLSLLGDSVSGKQTFLDCELQFMEWLNRARENITVDGEREIIADMDRTYRNYLRKAEILDAVIREDVATARLLYGTDILLSSDALRNHCMTLRTLNEEAMQTVSDKAAEIMARSIWSIGVFGVILIVLGFVFSQLISTLIIAPVEAISAAAQHIAEGDYNVEVPIKTHDEIGLLAREFNTMAKRLLAYQEMNIDQLMAEKGKWEAIIRNIDDGIVVVDAMYNIMEINDTALRALDLRTRSVKHWHFLQVVPSEKLFSYLRQTIETGQPPEIEDGKNVITITLDDGKRFHYLFSITPQRSKSGAMSGAVLLLKNVTKLKELDHLKSEFVMIASHELRTPLTSIGMSIDLLLEKTLAKLDEKEVQLLRAAHEDTLRLKALVNDLLDLSKIEAGKIELEFESVQIGPIFEKVQAILQPQMADKQVEFSFSTTEGLPMIRADATKITWVLNNLASNALRYTDSGGHIHMSACRAGEYLHVSVEDDGTGIPYEYQTKIFEKFVRVKDDRHVSGSGLGLAICKEMVKAHGGTIWVDSKPGSGSTFTFTIPVVR